MTNTSELEKLVEKLIKKVYSKNKLAKHSKKVRKIRKKKGANKKAALHSSFRYADQLLAHNQKKYGYRPRYYYTPRRRRALYRMRPYRVRRMYDRTRMYGTNPYQDFQNIYSAMQHLDWINKQQAEYNRLNQQHQQRERESDEEEDEKNLLLQ